MRVVLAVLVACLAASGALAQQASPRQIDPEHFHPSAAGESAAPAPASPIVMPTKERPLGACDPNAHGRVACLIATSRQSDHLIDDAEQSVRAAIDKRHDLNPYLRNSLDEALTRIDNEWRKYRDRECDALAMLERGLPASSYEARLACRIMRNLERGEELQARYGGR
jgi:hypothetical protein